MTDTIEESRVPRLSPGEQWDVAIPEMGVFALLRNLRNFDRDEISDASFFDVRRKLENPDVIARSRILPFRFLTAYLNVPSIRWGPALERALELSLPNVPVLEGKTLILIDTSASMRNPMSVRPGRPLRKGEAEPVRPSAVQAAALFGFALAMKNAKRVDVYGFADGQFKVEGIGKGSSLLRSLDAFVRCIGNVGHGTQIASAMSATYSGHDRVAIFTDEQETFNPSPAGLVRPGWGWAYEPRHGDVDGAVPQSVPVYCWNLAGYEFGAMPVKGSNRHALAGLTDGSFRLMQNIEAGLSAKWPWEEKAA